MTERFGFRQIDRRDLGRILQDREIRAKNHATPQACHQTSYVNLVNMRGLPCFTLPYGGVVNDYVAFYFSPVTAFCHTIHQGNVGVVSPDGENLGLSSRDDRIFLVVRVEALYQNNLNICFSDSALNSLAPMPTVEHRFAELPKHVKWSLFDDSPMVANIADVGYQGVCKYFFSRAIPVQYQYRSAARMAELLVKEAVPTYLVECIIAPSPAVYREVVGLANAFNFRGAIVENAGCFV